MYVWFDALTNYLSGIGALDEGENGLKRYWPAAKHIIGKDIKWFHCVIWPTMLMSAGIPLPKSVFSHGFVNAEDGRKMSKTYNNTIDPHDMLARYPLDTLRYYITSSATYGVDLSFSETNMVQMHNSELADVLGNLVHRALNLSHKYCAGVVPDVHHDLEFHTLSTWPSSRTKSRIYRTPAPYMLLRLRQWRLCDPQIAFLRRRNRGR